METIVLLLAYTLVISGTVGLIMLIIGAIFAADNRKTRVSVVIEFIAGSVWLIFFCTLVSLKALGSYLAAALIVPVCILVAVFGTNRLWGRTAKKLRELETKR